MQSQCSLNTLLGTIYKEDKFAQKELHYTTLGRSTYRVGWVYILWLNILRGFNLYFD